MGRFSDLIKAFVITKTGDWEKDKEAFSAPARSQHEAATALPSLVLEAGFHLWESNDGICQNGARLVVGVAVWTRYDMAVMDALAEAAPILKTKNVHVEVFNFDDYINKGDANKRVPGIEDTTIYHSPIVGIWRGGELQEKDTGYKGRELIYDFLHNIVGRDMHPR